MKSKISWHCLSRHTYFPLLSIDEILDKLRKKFFLLTVRPTGLHVFPPAGKGSVLRVYIPLLCLCCLLRFLFNPISTREH
jgi:hypothetical protein